MNPPRPLRRIAIVPAAGTSRRMGRPKLLLPWGASTVLQSVLETWGASQVDRTILVVRSADQPLAEIGYRCGVDVVRTDPAPPDMKDSVRLALDFVRRQYQPDRSAWWLLSPADNPRLPAAVIDRVCRACADTDAEIVVPCCAGRRGHPVALAWPLAETLQTLADGEGVNALFSRHRVECLAVDDPAVLCDIDTLDDYERWR